MKASVSYVESAKQKAVFAPELKKPSTERTAHLRDTLIAIQPKLCSERAFLLTESMKETEGQPMVVRRARGLANILDKMSILIRPGELIVGNQATAPRAAPVFPNLPSSFS